MRSCLGLSLLPAQPCSGTHFLSSQGTCAGFSLALLLSFTPPLMSTSFPRNRNATSRWAQKEQIGAQPCPRDPRNQGTPHQPDPWAPRTAWAEKG